MLYKYRRFIFFAQEIETKAYNVYICNHEPDTALGPDLPGNIRVLLLWRFEGFLYCMKTNHSKSTNDGNSIFKRTEMPLCVPGKSAITTNDCKL